MSILNSNQMKSIEEQINTQFHKAFYDVLEEKVRQEPPDYDWITRLYIEIRTRLANLLKINSVIRQEIITSMDDQLFRQMIENKAFGGTELYNLISLVFEWCKKLGSPARDTEVDKLKFNVLNLMQNNATFAQIVPVFIKNANECIDNIYKDINIVKENISKLKQNQNK